jgi:hypothetical protein
MNQVDVDNLVKMIRDKYGDSSDETRKQVIHAFRGKDNLAVMAQIWANSHGIKYRGPDTQAAFATAVDLGYRMAKFSRKELASEIAHKLSFECDDEKGENENQI